MNFIKEITDLFYRMRYPISLPEDVSVDLGIAVHVKHPLHKDLFTAFQNPNCSPKRLARFMPRQEAEEVFTRAKKKETFKSSSLFSYYLHDGWLAVELIYDDQSRLRRLYVRHKDLPEEREEGIELLLPLNEADLKKVY